MTILPKVLLKAGKEKPIQRFHPWVFSGAIMQADSTLNDGDLTDICNHKGVCIAKGHYYKGNISLRILTFNPAEEIDDAFWQRKIQKALDKRKVIGYFGNETSNSNAFRLIHGEGDGLPGLIIDNYNGHLVVQLHTDGMKKSFPAIQEALIAVMGNHLKGIFNKSETTLKGSTELNETTLGEAVSKTVILENKLQFEVNWQEGQKTGFFLDQRDNRNLLKSISDGKTVLNTFCYTGGFSLYALAGGATQVTSVDISAKAMELLNENLKINDLLSSAHESLCQDVMVWLKENQKTYDIVVLDPPAFAKNIKSRHSAVQAYKRLNQWGMEAVAPKGMLLTFSCSQVVDNALFEHTVISAAIESGREVSILKRLGQSPDHPVSAFHAEGSYLKGLLLYLE